MQYRVTAPGAEPRMVSEKAVAAYFVEVCGGGYTVAQTAKAMTLLRETRDGTPHRTANGTIIEPITEETH